MAPSRNSTDVTKPPTRARTWTSSTASNRPVNSSQSVTVRLTGCATVTGGGAAAACGGGLSPQPDRVRASRTIRGLRSQNERGLKLFARAKRSDVSVAPKSISSALLPRSIEGDCPLQGQGESVAQSVQEPDGSKQ